MLFSLKSSHPSEARTFLILRNSKLYFESLFAGYSRNFHFCGCAGVVVRTIGPCLLYGFIIADKKACGGKNWPATAKLDEGQIITF